MDLRKLSSQKNKAIRLPGDARELIQSTIIETFAEEIENPRSIAVDGYVFSEEAFLRISLPVEGSQHPMNFECFMDFDSKA
ncbi:MAG: hypothetical protein KDD25_07970 [Bdellovibrionales bacterium]|nr:hypothetical protein [Bdellovibrionales bacterium]